MIQYIESQVNGGKVAPDDLACPATDCRLPFPDELLQQLLTEAGAEGHKLYERLRDFQARRFVPEPEEGERLVACPAPGCGKVLIPLELVTSCAEVGCPNCGNGFCAGCGQPCHTGKSCEAAEIDGMDPELRRLIQQQSWKRCPVCRNLCERESGCNFMTCPSEECQGKTFFCYLCGELLTAADHAAHYEGFEGNAGRMGPFGSVCFNRREADLSLPKKPGPPRLSVVEGDDEGSLALRITWGPHTSEPPTIYYHVRLMVPGTDEVKSLRTHARDAYHDIKWGVTKYRRYQAVVVPVNINGTGPASEPSEVIHFHERELEVLKEKERSAPAAPKSKRWAVR